MSTILLGLLAGLLSNAGQSLAQQNCYYGPGAGFRGPSELVPCNTTGSASACCLLGDTCLSGNACYNFLTGNTYQYGCTDINYEDASCPRKCGWDPAKSPWIGLSFCSDIQDMANTWTCMSPESCGCEWDGSYALQILPSRACAAMGSEARVAISAPSTLLAYVSLPSTAGGSTGYYSTTTDSDGAMSVISTAINGYTPDSFTQFTTYRDLGQNVMYINPGATASPSTLSAAYIYTGSTPFAQPAAPTSSAAITSAPGSSSRASSTLSTTSSSQTSASASESPTNSDVPSGLSTGTKIGIGVGVAGGVLFLAAIGICCFLIARRRKTKKGSEAQQQQPPQYIQNPQMGSFAPGQQPGGWSPFPPQGMPYYVVPASSMGQKDVHSMTTSPAYSPPHSPPPPTELSTDHSRHGDGVACPQPYAASPRLGCMANSEVAAGRYA